jgi:hypothetical protein
LQIELIHHKTTIGNHGEHGWPHSPR